MHIAEGPFQQIASEKFAAFSLALQNLPVRSRLSVERTACMWNAGVIGLHSADAGLLNQVLELTDFLLNFTAVHIVEQFAFSWVLQRHTQLSEAADVVFHYWPPYLHQPFKGKLPQLWERAVTLPESERLAVLYRHRPRAGLSRRVRILVRNALQLLGIRPITCRCSEV